MLFISVSSRVLGRSLLIDERDAASSSVYSVACVSVVVGFGAYFSCQMLLDGSPSECEQWQLSVQGRHAHGLVLFSVQHSANQPHVCPRASALIWFPSVSALLAGNDVDVQYCSRTRSSLRDLDDVDIFSTVRIPAPALVNE